MAMSGSKVTARFSTTDIDLDEEAQYISDSDCSSSSSSNSYYSDFDDEYKENMFMEYEANELTEEQAELEERLANSEEYDYSEDEIKSIMRDRVDRDKRKKKKKLERSYLDSFSSFLQNGNLDFNQYQFDGMLWCLDREKNRIPYMSRSSPSTSSSRHQLFQLRKGGILGDEMGLGKTIVMLATMYCSDQRYESTPIRQTLIVVPVILLHQWAQQIELFIGIKPLLYHGPQRYMYDTDTLKSSQVILTTYHTLVYELKNGRRQSSEDGGRCSSPSYSSSVDNDIGDIEAIDIVSERECEYSEDYEVLEDLDLVDIGDLGDYVEGNIEEEDYGEEEEEDFGEEEEEDLEDFGWDLHSSNTAHGGTTRGGDQLFSLFDIKFHRLIFDEAHHLRSMNSKVFHCVGKITSNITWMITGTPLQNKRSDVVALLHLLGYDRAKFKENEEIAEILSKVFLKRTKAQVGIQMPSVNIRRVSSPWENVHEKNLTQKIHECLEPDVLRSKGVSTKMILPVMLYSRMMCVHPRMISKHIPALDRMGIIDKSFQDTLDIVEANSKINSVLSCLGSRISNGNNKIVFTQYHQESAFLQEKIKLMRKHYYSANTEGEGGEFGELQEKPVTVGIIDGRTPKIVRDQILRVTYDVLIIQIQTGNEGLNLQDYNEIYIVTPSWNPKLEEQAIARCHRLGQTKEVFVFKFVMEDFGTVTFEAPQTPVYVIDKRKKKKKKRAQILRRNRQEVEEEERDRVGEKRKRSDSDPADHEEEEEEEIYTLPGDISEFAGGTVSGESNEGRIYKRARKGGEDEEDYFFPKGRLLDEEDDEEEDDYKEDIEDIDTESPVETNMNKHYEQQQQQQQRRVLLKFDSEWTGTSKNIEMYSEELQERKNQLEIDIGLTSYSG